MTLNIDRSEWQRVKFGDVVRNVNDNVKDPAGIGIKRVLGLEHLDPGELRIQRWGDVVLESTFTRRVRPGQTLFGKRRAYQRKTAYAEFDAVCSGDILVFESADSSRLLPEMLPFVAMSDAFYALALETSAGSLSPRTRWSDIAKYEFDLPPLDEQRRIAALLWSIEAALTDGRQVEAELGGVIALFCEATFKRLRHGDAQALGDVARVQMGRQKAPKYMKGDNPAPYLSVVNVGSLELDLRSVDVMDFDVVDRAKYRLNDGDILLTEGDLVSPRNVGRPAIYRGSPQGCCFQNTLLRLAFPSWIPPEYALAVLEGMRLSGVFAAAASTTTVTHLGLKRLSPLSFPLADEATRQAIAGTMAQLLKARASCREQVVELRLLSSRVLSEVLCDLQ